MNDLAGVHPDGVLTEFGHSIFYFGTKPKSIFELETGSEFTLVYSPSEEHDWEVVSYRVIYQKLSYAVVSRRELSPSEIEYFDELLKSNLK